MLFKKLTSENKIINKTHSYSDLFFFFFYLIIIILREFQLMASAPDNSSLSSDQDTNQFFM